MAREAAASAKGGTNLGGGSGQPPLSQVRLLQGPHSPCARQKTLAGTNSAPASV